MTNNKQQTAVEFVPYELALELKQLGFDEPCFGVYFNPTQELLIGKKVNEYTKDVRTPASTYSQAFRWFRDNGKVAEIFSQLLPSNKYKWGFKIQGIEGVTDGFFTYEEAELACLRHLIKTVKAQLADDEQKPKRRRKNEQ
jgi:hypothetical protein